MALRSSIQAACIFLKLGCAFAALPLLFSCTNKSDKVLAEVGRFTITAGDADFREKVIQVFYPGSKEPNAGYIQLREAFLTAQILENNGWKVDDAILEKESLRIDRETQAPATLEKIKNAFGADQAAYRKVFVLPTLAERTIYFDFFLHSPQVQAQPISAIKQLLDAGKNGLPALQALAAQSGFGRSELSYEKARGFFAKGENKESQPIADPASAKALAGMREKALGADAEYFRRHEAEIKKGAVLSEPLDRDEVWLVLYPKNKGAKAFLAFVVPKVPYDKWLQAERQKVGLREFN